MRIPVPLPLVLAPALLLAGCFSVQERVHVGPGGLVTTRADLLFEPALYAELAPLADPGGDADPVSICLALKDIQPDPDVPAPSTPALDAAYDAIGYHVASAERTAGPDGMGLRCTWSSVPFDLRLLDPVHRTELFGEIAVDASGRLVVQHADSALLEQVRSSTAGDPGLDVMSCAGAGPPSWCDEGLTVLAQAAAAGDPQALAAVEQSRAAMASAGTMALEMVLASVHYTLILEGEAEPRLRLRPHPLRARVVGDHGPAVRGLAPRLGRAAPALSRPSAPRAPPARRADQTDTGARIASWCR